MSRFTFSAKCLVISGIIFIFVPKYRCITLFKWERYTCNYCFRKLISEHSVKNLRILFKDFVCNTQNVLTCNNGVPHRAELTMTAQNLYKTIVVKNNAQRGYRVSFSCSFCSLNH